MFRENGEFFPRTFLSSSELAKVELFSTFLNKVTEVTFFSTSLNKGFPKEKNFEQ